MIAAVGRSCPTRMQACQKDLPPEPETGEAVRREHGEDERKAVEPTEMMMELTK